MNYDPNLTNSGNMADHVVKLTFGQWEYRTTIQVTVGGNCTGLSVINAAISNALGTLPWNTVGSSEVSRIVLTNQAGDTLECEDEDLRYEDWLSGMLVAAEIVSIAPAQKEEVK